MLKDTFFESRMDEFLKVANDLEIKEISNGVEIQDPKLKHSETIKIDEEGDEDIHGDEENSSILDFYYEISMNAQEELVGISQNMKIKDTDTNLVPEDLQSLIISSNPERDIKFTLSQRMNTQMVIDDYLLKKRKGPYYSGEMRVINCRCVKYPACPYYLITNNGQINNVH